MNVLVPQIPKEIVEVISRQRVSDNIVEQIAEMTNTTDQEQVSESAVDRNVDVSVRGNMEERGKVSHQERRGQRCNA